MKKVALILLSAIFIFAGTQQQTRADSVMLPDGSVVKGKIVSVLGGMIEIKTDQGRKLITRNLKEGEARDIVEVGFLLRKRIMGEIFYLSGLDVEMSTASGNLSINRINVREIILSQQIPLEAAPHH